jgi:hypothetical protein
MLTVVDPGTRVMVPQNTPGWIKARIGCCTGSRMRDVLAVSTDKKRLGEPLKKRLDYAMELVAERMTDAAASHFVTDAMQWGLDHEAAAREAYEQVTGNTVLDAGFVLHPRIEFFGASPDGFVDSDIVTEFKCPTTTTHLAWMMAGVVPEEHKPQLISECAVTGRRIADFASFDPRLPPRQRIFIRRYIPTPEEVERIEMEAIKFLAEVEAMFGRVTTTEIAA